MRPPPGIGGGNAKALIFREHDRLVTGNRFLPPGPAHPMSCRHQRASRPFIVFMGRFLDTRTRIETGKIARAYSILPYCVSPYRVNPSGETVIRALHKNRACSIARGSEHKNGKCSSSSYDSTWRRVRGRRPRGSRSGTAFRSVLV